MRNIKAVISYCGTNYHGFQRQNNAVAIQNVIEGVLSRILASDTVITGCSRTDAGVHANYYCFSFVTESGLACDKIQRGLNALLPQDIAVMSVEDASPDFHARYSCVGKEYEYLILNREVRDPFYVDRVLHYPWKIDAKLLDNAASHFVGTHDFTSFCGTANQRENSVRTIHSSRVYEADEKGFVRFVVSGDGFLFNMVRIMVGTLLSVNEGRLSADDIPSVIEARDRTKAGKTAEACGLYLNRVFY